MLAQHRPCVATSPYRSSTKATELHAIALKCAREFSPNYNDQQDLASQALLSALQYEGDIEFPKQFMRRTVRNLAINYSRSVSTRELTGYENEGLLDTAVVEHSGEPVLRLALRDTLSRMEERLSPAERHCYQLLRQGYEQQDLPRLLNISRQAVSKMFASIRRKYLAAEAENC